MSPKHCPTCGGFMRRRSHAIRSRHGVVGVVTEHRCSQCRTVVDDLGNVMTLRDQADAEYEAVKATRRAST